MEVEYNTINKKVTSITCVTLIRMITETLNGMSKKIDKLKIFFFAFYIKFKVKLTFFYNIHATAFLNMLKSNVQKTLKINVQ